MKFVYSLFSEKGEISSMRVMSMISLLISGYVAIYGLTTHADMGGLAVLCGVFLSAAFGGKTAQKMIETKRTDTLTNNQVKENLSELKLSN
jgi:hypothetical protein